jgi:hypothetical protein
MIMSVHHNAEQNHNFMIAQTSSIMLQISDIWEGQKKNCTDEEIKNRLNLRSACYHSVHNSIGLLSKMGSFGLRIGTNDGLL